MDQQAQDSLDYALARLPTATGEERQLLERLATVMRRHIELVRDELE